MAIFYHVCSTSYFDSLPVFNNILIVIRIICPNVTIGNLPIILQKDISHHYFIRNVGYPIKRDASILETNINFMYV